MSLESPMEPAKRAGSASSSVLLSALIQHAAKDMQAAAESLAAARYSAEEIGLYIASSLAEAFEERVLAAAAMVRMRPESIVAAQLQLAERALERYAAGLQDLQAMVVAGAKASREPLLERLR